MIHSDDNPAIRVSWLDRKAAESTSQHISAITHEHTQDLVAGIARPHKNIEQPVECTTRLPRHDAERNGTLDERVPPKFLYGGENQEVIKMSTKTRSLSQTVLSPNPAQITGITGDTGALETEDLTMVKALGST